MRIIKFRAWDKEGGMVQLLGMRLPYPDDYAYDYHVMQFTGLHDKNGVEIYEGDIIKEFGHGLPQVCVYRNGGFYLHSHGFQDWSFIGDITPSELEAVIGNVHENPELLQKGKE